MKNRHLAIAAIALMAGVAPCWADDSSDQTAAEAGAPFEEGGSGKGRRVVTQQFQVDPPEAEEESDWPAQQDQLTMLEAQQQALDARRLQLAGKMESASDNKEIYDGLKYASLAGGAGLAVGGWIAMMAGAGTAGGVLFGVGIVIALGFLLFDYLSKQERKEETSAIGEHNRVVERMNENTDQMQYPQQESQ
ncbi:MAG: hypothetical protein HYT79_10865 [Elusimicrobia bacterium]|nr:hypothetical protein [Elusimicrobiota bacterium]